MSGFQSSFFHVFVPCIFFPCFFPCVNVFPFNYGVPSRVPEYHIMTKHGDSSCDPLRYGFEMASLQSLQSRPWQFHGVRSLWKSTETFPYRHGVYPKKWMVYFMENPNQRWMIFGSIPILGNPALKAECWWPRLWTCSTMRLMAALERRHGSSNTLCVFFLALLSMRSVTFFTSILELLRIDLDDSSKCKLQKKSEAVSPRLHRHHWQVWPCKCFECWYHVEVRI